MKFCAYPIVARAFPLAAAAAVAMSAAVAGPVESPPPPDPKGGPVAPPPAVPKDYLWDELHATLSVGFDTDYVWRGIDLGETLIWTDLNIDFLLTDDLTLNAGAWYADTHDSGWGETVDQELDLYTGLTWDVGPVELRGGYIYYYFDDSSDQYHELYAGIGGELGPVDLGLTYFYELNESASYIQLTAETTFELTEWLDLVPGAVLSYSDSDSASQAGPYLTDEDDFHHAGASVTLNVHLTPTATLSPYVAWVRQLDALCEGDCTNQHEDKFYGGVKLSVTF